ncbi:MAG: M3 family metallopeptidase [Deltaproteobacteria bacterium]|nr:M3 family metallopeptidase [Deltaproteobacteria bacterium]
MANNPLLNNPALPRFSEISPEHVEAALDELLPQLSREFQTLEKKAEPSWEGLIEPLCQLEETLNLCWSPVAHLNSVANSSALRKSYQTGQKKVVDFSLRLSQSRPLYDALLKMQNGSVWETLDESQRRCIQGRALHAKLAGVGLEAKAKEDFIALSKGLSELETQFSNNVLDATKAYALVLKDKKDSEGLPESLLKVSAQNFKRRFDERKATQERGPWLITLESAVVIPFLENSKRRDLREQVYRAYITRASDGSYDNTPLMSQILQKRQTLARILGYERYADVSLAAKMVQSVDTVLKFEEDLRVAVWERGKAELEELRAFAREAGESEELRHWDLAYWAKRLQEHVLGFKEEELRPYFSLDRVLEGLFTLAKELFAVRIENADGQAPVWHKDVRFFKMFDGGGQHLASFYLDPFSRPENKRGGAWMNECLSRVEKKGKITSPVAYLVCNFTPPAGDTPSLLTFQEVLTLFHEFGHGLQHMLTKVRYYDVSGIRGVEWDAVELPSQFMENWCYHRPTLERLARHYKTGEVLPEEYFAKLAREKTFRAASQTLRQIQFALIDLKLHTEFDPFSGRSVFDVQKEVALRTSLLPPLEEDRFLCSFSHIFAGGYAAGYYGYKWAEVMSADAFAAFEEEDLDDEQAVRTIGLRFRNTILAKGGGRHPLEVFIDFRGREPMPDALLRHLGLGA